MVGEPYIWLRGIHLTADLDVWHYDWVMTPLRAGPPVHRTNIDKVYMGRWRTFPSRYYHPIGIWSR